MRQDPAKVTQPDAWWRQVAFISQGQDLAQRVKVRHGMAWLIVLPTCSQVRQKVSGAISMAWGRTQGPIFILQVTSIFRPTSALGVHHASLEVKLATPLRQLMRHHGRHRVYVTSIRLVYADSGDAD